MDEEIPVKVCHEHALIMSLPIVHTTRRYKQLNELVRSIDQRTVLVQFSSYTFLTERKQKI